MYQDDYWARLGLGGSPRGQSEETVRDRSGVVLKRLKGAGCLSEGSAVHTDQGSDPSRGLEAAGRVGLRGKG